MLRMELSYYSIEYKQATYIARIMPMEIAETDTEADAEYELLYGHKCHSSFMKLVFKYEHPEATWVSMNYEEPLEKYKMGQAENLYHGFFGFITSVLPWIKWISFNDTSLFPYEGHWIPLSNFYFLLHGQTWFERWFEAKPNNYNNYKKFQRSIQFSKNTLSNSFSRMWHSILINTGIEKETLEAMYDGAKTYKAFFNAIYNKYGMEPFIYLTHSSVFLHNIGTRHSSLYSSGWYIHLHPDIYNEKMTILKIKDLNHELKNKKWVCSMIPNFKWIQNEQYIMDFGDGFPDSDMDEEEIEYVVVKY
jgi:hypothetical protein